MSIKETSITFEFDTPEEAAAFLAGISHTEDEAPPEKEAPPKKKAAAKKAAKPAKKKVDPEPETDEEDPDAIGIDALRDVFQALVKDGKRADALALLKEYGVAKIHEVAEEDMAAMYKAAVELQGGDDDDDDLGI